MIDEVAFPEVIATVLGFLGTAERLNQRSTKQTQIMCLSHLQSFQGAASFSPVEVGFTQSRYSQVMLAGQ